MRTIFAGSVIFGIALMAYGLWELPSALALSNGDEQLSQLTERTNEVHDVNLLRIAAEGNAMLAKRWSQVAGRFKLLFCCAVLVLSMALFGVAALTKQSFNKSLSTDAQKARAG
jgi:hypothetical protein